MPKKKDHSQPVPKEEEVTSVPSEGTTATTSHVPLAGPSQVQSEQVATTPETIGTQTVQQAQVATDAAPAQPQVQPQPQQVIIKEKKKGGMCNTTTCCIGSCVGCLILIIALVLLGIFAAPTLSNLLNKALNAGIEIPEVRDVDTTKLEDTLSTIPDQEQQQTLTITEDEFNTLLRKWSETEGETALSLDSRADFEKDTAKILLKLAEWMPWAVIEITNDTDGKLETSSFKLGPLDLTNYFKDTLEQEFQVSGSSSNQLGFDISDLFASVLFKDKTDQVDIQAIYFDKDEMRVTVTTAIGPEDIPIPENLE